MTSGNRYKRRFKKKKKKKKEEERTNKRININHLPHTYTFFLSLSLLFSSLLREFQLVRYTDFS